MNKLLKLKSILTQNGSALLAFSGGVDSTFLLKVAYDCLGKEVLAVTAVSQTYPAEELTFAKSVAKKIGARHKIIKTNELKNKSFNSNPRNRCYYCKRELFTSLKSIARKNKINFVIDASNISDKSDYRPGAKAKRQLGVRSPLAEAGFTKGDIRFYSKKYRLPTWNKPALACLASRIPYGTKISPDLLKRINAGETFLKKIGFPQVRLRTYDAVCRIEVPKDKIVSFIKKRNLIVARLKMLGYNYITLDLEGYRTGSMNELFRHPAL